MIAVELSGRNHHAGSGAGQSRCGAGTGAGRRVAHVRHVRQCVRLLPPLVIGDDTLGDGLDVFIAAIEAGVDA